MSMCTHLTGSPMCSSFAHLHNTIFFYYLESRFAHNLFDTFLVFDHFEFWQLHTKMTKRTRTWTMQNKTKRTKKKQKLKKKRYHHPVQLHWTRISTVHLDFHKFFFGGDLILGLNVSEKIGQSYHTIFVSFFFVVIVVITLLFVKV